MADVKRADEVTEFPEKRKLDLPKSISNACEEEKGKASSNKKQKIDILTEENGSGSVSRRENVTEPGELPETNADADDEDSIPVDTRKNVAKPEECPKINADAPAEDEDEDDEDEDEYNGEQDEEGDEDAVPVDRKGKGIMKDDKGKGKMIADSDDDSGNRDDDDDDSSDGSDSEFTDGLDGSDADGDLLAEVDLGNILPSRTRQTRGRSGVRIVSDSEKGNDA